MKVQVKDLQIGDQLSTGTVASKPWQVPDSIQSGSDKMYLEIERNGGFRKGKLWHKNTTVTVKNR